MHDVKDKIASLQGPILVLGASGFVGANLFRNLLKVRSDVYGTASRLPSWRLDKVPRHHLLTGDLLIESHLRAIIEHVKPRTIFSCTSYGAYSFEKDPLLIYQTNLTLLLNLITELQKKRLTTFIHAGSSSEYGELSAGPSEDSPCKPNSHYSVSKIAASALLSFAGKKLGIRCASLRLYSVYGPLEDSSRLIPSLIIHGTKRQYPKLVQPDISRDFIYVDDVCEAFIVAALCLKEQNWGDSFNVGTGKSTTIEEISRVAQRIFSIEKDPEFGSMPNRSWDILDWYANIDHIQSAIGWSPNTDLETGLAKTIDWFKSLDVPEDYIISSKVQGLDTVRSISAIIACYKDAQAIPIMYDRLVTAFENLKIDYEIIFVNDNSPDDSEEVIRKLSLENHRVIGISHSRNFGSQAAFRSGMEIATKNACVLLDGDLQDPPEMISNFFLKWKEGYDVVFGRRIQREAPLHMRFFYKFFYILFDKFSYINIPRDAGDFSLLDKRVVEHILKFPERDFFLRGIRAFTGFKQVGVDYIRPERMFGTTTNNFLKNIDWAKKGILSFSNAPLTLISYAGVILFLISLTLILLQALLKIVYPQIAPQGMTTLISTTIFFGALNLFAISVLGEYIRKILEETKQRPHFIRRSIIRNGRSHSPS